MFWVILVVGFFIICAIFDSKSTAPTGSKPLRRPDPPPASIQRLKIPHAEVVPETQVTAEADTVSRAKARAAAERLFDVVSRRAAEPSFPATLSDNAHAHELAAEKLLESIRQVVSSELEMESPKNTGRSALPNKIDFAPCFADGKSMDRSQVESKILKNKERGLPARSHFPWSDDEKDSLIERHKSGDSFEVLAMFFERRATAIGAQLRKLEQISGEDLDNYMLSSKRENVIKGFHEHGFHNLWHMTHRCNVRNILKYGILNHYLAHDMKDSPVDISDPEAQKWRERIDPVYNRRIHEYAPLYFTPKNPMLYVRRKIQSDLCLLNISLDALTGSEFIFSDGNAASRDTKFFRSSGDLSGVPWEVLRADLWTEFPDGKRQRCAEVLVHPKISPAHIDSIHCYSQEMFQNVGSFARNVKVSRNLFF